MLDSPASHVPARPLAAVPTATTGLGLLEAARLPVADVLSRLGTSDSGLSAADAAERLRTDGPNAVRDHRASAWAVLASQVRSPLLALLAATAVVSFFLGERTDSLVIGVILVASIGLGFVNEFRAERMAQALHQWIRHTVTVLRDGQPTVVDVTDLVRGDVVKLHLGGVVPADLRLLQVDDFQCDESILTGESSPVAKSVAPLPEAATVTDLTRAR